MNVFHSSPDYDQMMFHYHKLLNKGQFEDDSCYYPTMNDNRGDVATSFKILPPQVSPRYWWQKNSPVYRKIIPSHVCLFKPANVATLRHIHHKHIVSLCLSTLGFYSKLWLLCEKAATSLEKNDLSSTLFKP